MAQIPIPFSSSFRSLTLNVTTGTAPNQVTHTQPITSVFKGNNSFPITDAGILTAFNSQAVGTSFTPSIDAKYGSDGNGNALTTISTPSVASFIPRPPPPPPISRASNNVTIQYMGAAGDVPTSSAWFIEANPRGTGMEWFAVVKDGMKQAITNYAKGTSSTPFERIPGDNSTLVPFKNIVTSLMTNMSDMFNNTTTFNSDIGSWDVSKVTYMNGMFGQASAFNNGGNSSIGLWNTTNVRYMSYMFYQATVFNQDIHSWDASYAAAPWNNQISNFRHGSALSDANTPSAIFARGG